MKVSVVMPAFNAEKYIPSAVKSVLSQTYKDFELIIIDDASTDDTEKIIGSLDDSRIRIIRNDINRGVAFSRNLGVKEAKGRWIAFLDSDDIWETEKLQKQINLVEKDTAVKFCFTGSTFINAEGRKKNYILHVPQKISKTEILKQNLISCSSVLIDRNLMIKYPMSEEQNIHEDFYSWIKMLEEIEFAYGIDEPLLIYRISDSSKSGNKLMAAKMNWNTYRKAGIPMPSAAASMICYAINGIKKYRAIIKAGNKE